MEDKDKGDIGAIFKEFGKHVQKERLQKGYSLDDVVAHLKISLNIIQSIEEGNFDTIPYFVYLKGFIRSYALFLGISDYEIRSFFQKIEAKKIEVQENSDSNAEKKKKVYTFGFIFFVLILGCFFYFDGFGIYNLFKPQQWISIEKLVTKGTGIEKALSDASGIECSEQTQNKEKLKMLQKDTISEEAIVVASTVETSNPTKEKIDIVSQEKFLDVVPSTTLKQDTELTVTKSGDAAKSSEPAGVKNESIAVAHKDALSKKNDEQNTNVDVDSETLDKTKVAAKKSSQPESEVKPIHINKPGQRNVVILKGVDECWVHSTADAKETRQFSIQPGQLFALSFQDSLVLKLGNAGGVEIKCNGEKIPPVGRKGQVKTISLPISKQN